MASTINLSIKMDKGTKLEAEELARRLGTNLSSVVNILMTGFVRTQKIPESYVNANEKSDEKQNTEDK